MDSNLHFIEDTSKLTRGDKIVVLTKDAKINANIEDISKEVQDD